jgi:shikimate kinase
MGSGKSSVGRALARRLGWDLVDTDARIVEDAGMSIAEIFEREGEAGFRARETAVLADLPEACCVVALGGGAVIASANRALLRRKGQLIWLDGSPEQLARRVRGSRGRPLLAGLDRPAIVERLRELREERAEAYASADLRIDTDGRRISAVCDAILVALRSEIGA